MPKMPILLLLLVGCVACTSPAPREELPDLRPGHEPPVETAEAGLWMQMEKFEQNLKTSGLRVRDPALNEYIKDTVCKIAGPHCGDIRVYILRIPEFNASMAPNGMMQVWTGLLLRATNEAQVAYVLGHEIGHFLRRHSLQIWQDTRRKSSLFAYFNLLSAIIGIPGYAYNVAQLATLGSLFEFSRDAEWEADQLGFELTTKAGYEPREAAKLWRILLEERDAADEPTPWVFFSTHPPTEERIKNLERLGRKADPGIIGEKPYRAAIDPWLETLLDDELQQRRFARTQIVLNHLLETKHRQGELYYFQGELYRLRDKEGDEEKAEQAYAKALNYPDTPVETYRELGLLSLKRDENQQARIYLQQYLEMKPEAEDREMIRAYLQELE
ncbi:peptidase M48 Ste24p [Nitrosococcus halophilus Nc 4]|uniref:Peptidase M48 Ste24p n=1 Tax=Nitrosococcus halophilus (strain Nc4) TaxID=472759 RepID=D5C4D2_NITHN|nr:M48 family metalloprotease [Nitrosococcus halophilus]ADE15116.1 peptidase M48 Ste24p [Nitrosococcus halophilus Nc 4]